MNRKQKAFDDWLKWLNIKFPGSRSKILARTHSPLGADDTTGGNDPAWYDQIVAAASTIIPTYYNYKLQSKLVDAQIARAQTGQAPLSTADYTAMASSLQPTVRHEISTGLTQQDKNMLWIGGGIIAALYLLPRLTNG